MAVQAKKKHTGAVYFWAGFLIPTLIAGIGFFLIGVWPSGDGTVLIIDSLHQYLPFYTDFHEKLRTGQGLLYSFSAGLGYNFWATWAYYLASPLNFLIVLVPTANVCDFMDLMILLKIGLCGGTLFLVSASAPDTRRRCPSCRLWQHVRAEHLRDRLLFQPDVARFDRDASADPLRDREDLRDRPGQAASLARTGGSMAWRCAIGIWCNYYIGFMLCIFAVLYFLVCLIIAGQCRPMLFVRRILRFAWFSLLAGGMGAVVLLPAYRALTRLRGPCRATSFPKVLQFYDSLRT